MPLDTSFLSCVVDLYHPSGALVKIEFSATTGEIVKQVSALMSEGLFVRPPEVEAGEERQDVGFVVRRTFEKDGETCPVVDLYSVNPRAVFKVLKVYLNREEDVVAFEKVSGLSLAKMPEYIGTGDIERGKSKQLDKFVVPAPRPFTVFMKDNPKWKEEDAKKAAEKKEVYPVAKKKFVRWGEMIAKTAQEQTKPQTAAQNSKPKDDDEYAAEVLWWKHYLGKDPAVSDVTATYKAKVMAEKDINLAKAIWEGPLAVWRAQTGCEWDKDAKGFVPPKEAPHSDPEMELSPEEYGPY